MASMIGNSAQEMALQTIFKNSGICCFPTERHSQWVLRLYDHSQRGALLSNMYQVIQRISLLKEMRNANLYNGVGLAYIPRFLLPYLC